MRFWPLSRKNCPIQFSRTNGEQSRFQKYLRWTASNIDSDDIWVTVSARNIDTLRGQVSELGLEHRVKVFIEPTNRGDLNSLAAICLSLAKSAGSARFVAMEAHRPPDDEDALSRLCQVFQSSAKFNQVIVSAAERINPGLGTRSSRLKIDPKLCSDKLCEPALGDHSGSIEVQSRGIFFFTAKLLAALLDTGSQANLKDCDTATRQGYSIGDAHWPDINLWSMLPHLRLPDVLQHRPDIHKVRLVDFSVPASLSTEREETSQNFYENNSSNCRYIGHGPKIILDGCENLDILAAPDVVLIKGWQSQPNPSDISDFLEKRGLHHLYETPDRHHAWGDETELDHGDGYLLRMLSIKPGGHIERHFHNHRSESLQVITGQGRMTLGTETRQLSPGEFISIPPKVIHGLINTHNQTMRIIECRRGAYLSNVDHIKIEMNMNSTMLPSNATQPVSELHHHHSTG